jgi:integrase/recombinase XerD
VLHWVCQVIFRAERALGVDGSVDWVGVDAETYDLHVEATSFLVGLRGRDRSPNTIRAYASRVALFLTYCSTNRVDWREPGFLSMKRFKGWLVSEPLPSRGRKAAAAPQFRSEGSANAILTAVCEFLRFCLPHGWVPQETVAMLAEPKYLKFVPPGFDPGEDGQFRIVAASVFRFRVAEPGYDALGPDQVARMVELARNARDRFLVGLLGCTGLFSTG